MSDAVGVASYALHPQCLGGEQAGFCDCSGKTLHMAGGEFCVNATRSFGALLALKKARAAGTPDAFCTETFTVSVSGWQTPISLAVSGKLPSWLVTAKLVLPDCSAQEQEPGICFCALPGITHVLLDSVLHPFPEDPVASARFVLEQLKLEGEPAAGVTWWEERHGKLSIVPVVWVRDTQTLCPENACGSASLSLALHLQAVSGRNIFSISQPGGDCLGVKLGTNCRGEKTADISGRVRLVAEGTLYRQKSEEQ